ncbi:hypothetical protein [Streptomyces sp. NPDC059262]|uniref:hypothetical protein n=1 Tax=Streptomyces sp. NPDC059262 TaxID=3346797 RepID=UPI00369411B8
MRAAVTLVVAALLALPLLASTHQFAPAHTAAVASASVEPKACHGDDSGPEGQLEAIRSRNRQLTTSGSTPLPHSRAASPAPDTAAPATALRHASYLHPDRSIDELTAARLQVFRC